MTKQQKQAIKEFTQMRNLAELKALSKYSLENPLNDKQFKRIMFLKKECLEWMFVYLIKLNLDLENRV